MQTTNLSSVASAKEEGGSPSPRPVRKPLPHDPPHWLDPAAETWFLTLTCKPRGENQLARPEVWETLLETFLKHDELGHWTARLLVAMPDHLHALVSFPNDFHLQKRVASFKSWTAKHAGIVWQRDFFDHRLRSVEEAVAKRAYIEMNPVRAGLCATPDEWPYLWRGKGREAPQGRDERPRSSAEAREESAAGDHSGRPGGPALPPSASPRVSASGRDDPPSSFAEATEDRSVVREAPGESASGDHSGRPGGPALPSRASAGRDDPPTVVREAPSESAAGNHSRSAQGSDPTTP